jgi:hypothetical protein
MDNINYQCPMLRHVVKERLIASHPFLLFDIGCGLGIDPVWRFFGEDLHAHGFDPLKDEIEQLTRNEANPNVHYHAAFVGQPPSDPFHAARVASTSGGYFAWRSQLDRSSSSYAARLRDEAQAEAPITVPPVQPASPTPAERRAASVAAAEQWAAQPLATQTIALSEFAGHHGITNVDFVKTDTDGRDLEALASCEPIIRRAGILGFMVECFFNGSQDPTENSFHNVDAFMRRNGFLLYALTANRYSRATLPAPFLYPALYQTVSGQPVWGDMIYLRDGASPDYAKVFGDDLSPGKLLKLACLYELFQLPDCAAELIAMRSDRIRTLVNPEVLLDLLTPSLRGVRRSYREYLKLFEESVEDFYPN